MTDAEITNSHIALTELIKKNFTEPLTVELVTVKDDKFFTIMYTFGKKIFALRIPADYHWPDDIIVKTVREGVVDKMNNFLARELSKNYSEN